MSQRRLNYRLVIGLMLTTAAAPGVCADDLIAGDPAAYTRRPATSTAGDRPVAPAAPTTSELRFIKVPTADAAEVPQTPNATGGVSPQDTSRRGVTQTPRAPGMLVTPVSSPAPTRAVSARMDNPPAPIARGSAVESLPPPSFTVTTQGTESVPGYNNCRECAPCHPRPRVGWHCAECRSPFGICVRSTLNAQVLSGLQGQAVLYRYDFYDGVPDFNGTKNDPAQLNVRGEKQLRKISETWYVLPEPRLVLQPTGNPQLDAARRVYVTQRLSAYLQTAVSPEWVLVEDPDVPGTSGSEAVIHVENLRRQTQSASQPIIGGGTYGGNGSSGQGMSSQNGSN